MKKIFVALLFLGITLNEAISPLGRQISQAQDSQFTYDKSDWEDFYKQVEIQKRRDKKQGLSYIISGSLALLGGLAGATTTDDMAEKGIYTIFQTLGVASIGYGAYQSELGGEERALQKALSETDLSNEQRSQFLKNYIREQKYREKNDHRIRAITHGLIAALNFYSASQQTQSSLKGTLLFIGFVNTLAVASYSFEF